jgi:D-serine deaminase-like pyridoxal phosphate-dependent protein
MTATQQAIEEVRGVFNSPERWAELDTPCTIIAGAVVERNIRRMADYCRRHGIASRPHTKIPGQVVIDAGAKTLAADRCISAPDSEHGLIVEYPDSRITHLSEGHGQVDVSKCFNRPKVGDRVTIVPNHVCPTVNLTDFAWWLTEGGVEQLTIDARGKVR